VNRKRKEEKEEEEEEQEEAEQDEDEDEDEDEKNCRFCTSVGMPCFSPNYASRNSQFDCICCNCPRSLPDPPDHRHSMFYRLVSLQKAQPDQNRCHKTNLQIRWTATER